MKAVESFVKDRRGRKVGIVLNMRTYRRLLADGEELASIREYDTAKASGDERVPFEDAVREIERNRKK